MANRYGSIQSDREDQANGSVTRATSNGSPHHHDNPITQYLDKQLLNKDTDEQLEVIGYADRTVKKVFFWLLVILTAGLLLLLMYWKPEWKLKLTKTTCSLRRADTVLLKDIYGNVHIEPVVLISLIDGPIAGDSDTLQVYTIDVGSRSMGEFAYMEGEDGSHPADADDTTVLTLKVKVYLKYFDHRHVRYMWDQALLIFVQLRGLETGVTCGDLHDKYTGLSLEEQAHKLQVYGKNSIEVHVKSYFKLFFQEILNPFYIFQICSVILWSLDSYYIYASCIVLISAISLGVELYETRKSDTPFEVGIVRQFTFSSSLQRMSVMVRVLGAPQMDIYVKGAPEKVASLCKKDTLPEDFVFSLHRFTKQGYRVIALAMKSLDPKLTWHMAQRIPREQVESDLTFLGLLIMENMLKPQTAPVIRQLQAAEIRTVMATGDNILTAVSVAHQCGMIGDKERVIMVNAFPPDTAAPAKIEWQLADMETQLPGNQDTNPSDQPAEPSNRTQSHSNRDNEDENGEEMRDALDSMSGDPAMGNVQVRPPNVHDELYQQVSVPVDLGVPSGRYHFALTGRSFAIIRHHFPELLHKICVRGTVFARMSPDQKSQLVELLQDLGYCVGMCGDGANDCGALKAAHVGISLSEAEASVASPFTSKTANIECVPTLIREGRAALVTSFGVFKYMALYSIIQFVSVLILYTMETNFSDWMFLYIDLVITTTVAFLMGHTAAYPHLVAKRPPGSLVGPGNIISIILHILIVCSFQVFAFLYLVSTSWYAPPLTEEIDNYQTYETTVIFYVSAFQYLMLAFVFSKGPPYRKPLWTNVPFLIALIILLALNSLLVLYPFQFIKNILMLMDIPKFTFRLTLLGMVAVNFLIAFILETFIIPSMSFNRCANAIRRKKGPKNKYKLIEWELAGNQYWPLIGGLTLATGHATAFCPDQISVQLENR